MPATFWVIIFVPFVLLFLLLFFITLNRYIAYKERVALARLGYPPEEIARAQFKRYGNRGVLWGGVITGMSGLALLLGLSTLGTGAWLLAGLLPLFVGLGMVIVYFVTLGPPPADDGGAEDGAMAPLFTPETTGEKRQRPAGNGQE
jgi:hypothetical protein